MECLRSVAHVKGSSYHWLLSYTFWLSVLQDVMTLQTSLQPDSRVAYTFVLSDPPIGLFEPIEISPAVVPQYPNPVESSAPMYPSFPSEYEPVLTGKCPANFSSISSVLDKTASDCSAPLAALVGNVICCPQVNSLLHIFQGGYSGDSGSLVLQKADADTCFSDIVSILASRGANNTIPTLCSVKSSNLTGGSCPVKDVNTFEKTVNTSKLLEACSTVDPLKECCRPICQSAIIESTLQLTSKASMLGNANMVSDCKGVVYAWLSRRLSSDAANTAFRILSGCKVNKVAHNSCFFCRNYLYALHGVYMPFISATFFDLPTYVVCSPTVCPLEFNKPSPVIKACSSSVSPNPSCCSSLNTYIEEIQKQMLITNRQAINCATMFGSMLQKGGVMMNVFELCDVDLKDFSLQAYGQQGCLLQSLPMDIVFDNSTGFSFSCDLSDNIAAPWPSSSLSSLSLCAPEMSLPALPTAVISGNLGDHGNGVEFLVQIFLFLIFSLLL